MAPVQNRTLKSIAGGIVKNAREMGPALQAELPATRLLSPEQWKVWEPCIQTRTSVIGAMLEGPHVGAEELGELAGSSEGALRRGPGLVLRGREVRISTTRTVAARSA